MRFTKRFFNIQSNKLNYSFERDFIQGFSYAAPEAYDPEIDKEASVKVSDTVYPGTQIIISDVSKMIKESVQHCKFVRSQGSVKMLGL